MNTHTRDTITAAAISAAVPLLIALLWPRASRPAFACPPGIVCNDGWRTPSTRGRGTCSHHGGIA